MLAVKKKTRRKIKKFADTMVQLTGNTDYRYDCFLQAYAEANMRDRRLYDIEINKLLRSGHKEA